MSTQTWVVLAVTAATAVLPLFTCCSRRDRSQPDQSTAEGNTATQREIDQAVSEWVDRKVREGFGTREEIVQTVTEIIEDEYESENIRGRVVRETDRLLEGNRYLGNSLHRGDGPCKVPVGALLGHGGGSAGGTFATATGLGFARFFLSLGQPVFGMGLHPAVRQQRFQGLGVRGRDRRQAA